MPAEYEVVVVGGGPGGLTAALYTTRLGHETALINREGGRYTAVEHVHNLIGVSEETTGREITELAFAQLEEYGADRYDDTVADIDVVGGEGENGGRRFRVGGRDVEALADRVVLATGFKDAPPSFPELTRYTGHGLHYCLHCDAYSLIDEPVFVFGHTESAAHAAMVLLNFTADVELLLNGAEPEWNEEVGKQLGAHPLEVREEEAVAVHPRDSEGPRPEIGAIEFADGTVREYTGGFAMYGSTYNNELAVSLGCELAEDGAVEVDDHGRTSVEGVYAVGDVTHGHNQTPIAMGDGAKAGIALHHELRTFPLSPDAIGSDGGETVDVEVPGLPDGIRETAREVNESDEHAGMTPGE
ncbi:NAD(P)/FAD-dependent oxidoreductase [Halalkalicoccus tibetensis]|uniref:NAD(P)/FAD-dependent oxidoreductase n=1 Tax=Halalkalicoccus tibetensis TaxID=175632 RepID=A0ABD5V4J7_9EURY